MSETSAGSESTARADTETSGNLGDPNSPPSQREYLPTSVTTRKWERLVGSRIGHSTKEAE